MSQLPEGYQMKLTRALVSVMDQVDEENPPSQFFAGAALEFGVCEHDLEEEYERIYVKPDRDYFYRLWRREKRFLRTITVEPQAWSRACNQADLARKRARGE